MGWSDSNTVIRNSYSTGSVTGSSQVGGLVGRANTIIIENSYAEGSAGGREGKTSVEMKKQIT